MDISRILLIDSKCECMYPCFSPKKKKLVPVGHLRLLVLPYRSSSPAAPFSVSAFDDGGRFFRHLPEWRLWWVWRTLMIRRLIQRIINRNATYLRSSNVHAPESRPVLVKKRRNVLAGAWTSSIVSLCRVSREHTNVIFYIWLNLLHVSPVWRPFFHTSSPSSVLEKRATTVLGGRKRKWCVAICIEQGLVSP